MNLNQEKLKKCYIDVTNESELINYLRSRIDFLYCSNKNLTKKQYFSVCELKDVIECLEVAECNISTLQLQSRKMKSFTLTV